jgi:hypothetical protein
MASSPVPLVRVGDACTELAATAVRFSIWQDQKRMKTAARARFGNLEAKRGSRGRAPSFIGAVLIFTRENPGEIGCLAVGEGDSQPVTEGRRWGSLPRGPVLLVREDGGSRPSAVEEGRVERRAHAGWLAGPHCGPKARRGEGGCWASATAGLQG